VDSGSDSASGDSGVATWGTTRLAALFSKRGRVGAALGNTAPSVHVIQKKKSRKQPKISDLQRHGRYANYRNADKILSISHLQYSF
jgi:hypothetical protein